MTTVGTRLKELSGLSGATVGQMLFAIGGGATTFQSALVAYSGLVTGTVAQHLMVDVVRVSGNGGQVYPFTQQVPRRKRTDQQALLITLL